MPFHENLKEAMHINNLTTKELAQKSGISEGTINNYLKTNGSIPPVDKALVLAKTLNVSVDFLVLGFQNQKILEKNMKKDYRFHKYSEVLENLDLLSENERAPIINMISEMSRTYKVDKINK